MSFRDEIDRIMRDNGVNAPRRNVEPRPWRDTQVARRRELKQREAEALDRIDADQMRRAA